MALPSLVMPTGTPHWRVAPHDVEIMPPFAVVPFTSGHTRRRRTATGGTRRLQAQMLLTGAQALAVHDWFEDDLAAGALPFAARTLSPEGQIEWWHARFAEPPQWAGIASSGGVLWDLSAVLRLEGDASASAPA